MLKKNQENQPKSEVEKTLRAIGVSQEREDLMRTLTNNYIFYVYTLSKNDLQEVLKEECFTLEDACAKKIKRMRNKVKN